MKDWVQIQKLKLALTASFLERTNHLFLQFWNQDMWIVTTFLSDDPLFRLKFALYPPLIVYQRQLRVNWKQRIFCKWASYTCNWPVATTFAQVRPALPCTQAHMYYMESLGTRLDRPKQFRLWAVILLQEWNTIGFFSICHVRCRNLQQQ